MSEETTLEAITEHDEEYEEDVALGARLLEWLNDQPEWGIIKNLSRMERQAIFYRLATDLMGELQMAPRPGRAVSRKAEAKRAKQLERRKTALKARSAKDLARMRKHRARALARSVERAEELAYIEDQQRQAFAKMVAAMEEEEKARGESTDPETAED